MILSIIPVQHNPDTWTDIASKLKIDLIEFINSHLEDILAGIKNAEHVSQVYTGDVMSSLLLQQLIDSLLASCIELVPVIPCCIPVGINKQFLVKCILSKFIFSYIYFERCTHERCVSVNILFVTALCVCTNNISNTNTSVALYFSHIN